VQNATCDGLPCARGGSSPNGLEWLSPVRANLAFLAIPVPKGDVQFELVYLPDSVRIGGAISIATVMAVAAAALVRLWGRRR